ncbi:hypothetical protein [Actinomadura harenae]|uniref:Secreted protein n=1 Tax=Actinomadura harenae TaxID=2483351 RepID=A0A3M2MD63_9ACTN|nr:hypothetical protein [Actinomadura harenae]RMI47479.1 hypothetical protein EBO15_02975 [Actinomadura harenae]
MRNTRRFRLQAAAGAGILAGLTGPIALTGAAQAAPTAKGDCQVTEITLHGSRPATHRCLRKEGTVTPNVSVVKCDNSRQLELFWDSPISAGGPVLCILGKGWLNLADGDQADGRNWNDKASAWRAGCSSGHFDENAGWSPGKQQYFDGGDGPSAPSGIFDGQQDHLANDTLTVVTLEKDC